MQRVKLRWLICYRHLIKKIRAGHVLIVIICRLRLFYKNTHACAQSNTYTANSFGNLVRFMSYGMWRCNVSCMSYVYRTVHHLYSWVKRDQLDVTCFIISLHNAQHVSDVNTSILRSLRLMCWVISWVVFLWFDVCWCYVVVRLWWCGIRTQVEALLLQCY